MNVVYGPGGGGRFERARSTIPDPPCPSSLPSLRSKRKTALPPTESDPPAVEQYPRLVRSLQDLLASDLASVTFGQLPGMVLSGVSLGEHQAHLRDHGFQRSSPLARHRRHPLTCPYCSGRWHCPHSSGPRGLRGTAARRAESQRETNQSGAKSFARVRLRSASPRERSMSRSTPSLAPSASVPSLAFPWLNTRELATVCYLRIKSAPKRQGCRSRPRPIRALS